MGSQKRLRLSELMQSSRDGGSVKSWKGGLFFGSGRRGLEPEPSLTESKATLTGFYRDFALPRNCPDPAVGDHLCPWSEGPFVPISKGFMAMLGERNQRGQAGSVENHRNCTN